MIKQKTATTTKGETIAKARKRGWKEGWKEGWIRGRKDGREEMLREIVMWLHENHFLDTFIAEIVDQPVATVRRIVEEEEKEYES